MSNNNVTHYLAGMQEVVGKTVAFLLTTIFFCLYAFARDSGRIGDLTPLNVFAMLALFWFIYECLTFISYLLFSLFLNERNKNKPVEQTTKVEEPKNE